MCTVLLPPGDNQTAVNKYIKYHKSHHNWPSISLSLNLLSSTSLRLMNQSTDVTLHSLHWDDVTLLLTFRVSKPKKSSCYGTAAKTPGLERCFNVVAWPSKLCANDRKLYNGTAASLHSPGQQITLIQVVQLNPGPARYCTTAERQMRSFAGQILTPA
jgi:hypothetical protein